MSVESNLAQPKIERRREVLYGTAGIAIYRDGSPVLCVPDNLGSLTKNLSHKELEALNKEIKKYLQSASPDERVD